MVDGASGIDCMDMDISLIGDWFSKYVVTVIYGEMYELGWQ